MKAKYPAEENVPREFKTLTNLRHFSEAYNRMMLIKRSTNRGTYNVFISGSSYNQELCISVCCMINELSSEFLTSVITALEAIGIKPGDVSRYYHTNVAFGQKTYVCPIEKKLRIYPLNQSYAYGNVWDSMTLLDWPTILVYFGCCMLILFKKFTNEENFQTFMTNSICQLRERARCDPDVQLDIPFDFKEANAIKTMIGSCSVLCKDSINFLLNNMNCQNSGIGLVCQYLANELAWMDMHHLVLVNDHLVVPQSPVLRDYRVSREVENLNQAIAKVSSDPCPQFYMFNASNLERLKIEPSMFPTLIAVAEVLEKGNNNVTNLESSSTKTANRSTVQSLVTLHQTAFPRNHSMTSGVQVQAVQEENRQKRSRTSSEQLQPVKEENRQKHSRTSSVQMQAVKEDNRQKRSRTSIVQMQPVKEENSQRRSRTPREQKSPISRASNVQMPLIKQEKNQLIILD